MAASPAVSQYDPSYDPGQPAIVAFALTFMGERSRINEQMRAERLKRADPTQYDKMIEIEMRSIAELQERKAKIQQNKIQGYADISSDLMKGVWQHAAQQEASYANRKVAEIEAQADLDRTFSEERKFRAELLNIPADVAAGMQKGIDRVGDMDATKPADLATEVESVASGAISKAGGTASARDAVNYEIYQQLEEKRVNAESRYLAAEKAGDAGAAAAHLAETNKYVEAIEHMRGKFPNGEPSTHMNTQYPSLLESETRKREAKVKAGVGPPQDPMATFHEAAGTMFGGTGTVPAPAATPGTAPAPAQAGPAGAAPPANTPAQRRAAQEQGGGGAGGIMGMLDAAVNPVVSDIDADIAAGQERLKRLLDKRETAASSSLDEAFFGSGPNYLLSSPFRGQHKGQAVLDRLAAMDPKTRSAFLNEIVTEGGRVRPHLRRVEREGVEAVGDARLLEADPGSHYDNWFEDQAGERLYQWMASQLTLAAQELATDGSQRQGFERYQSVRNVVAALPESAVRRATPLIQAFVEADAEVMKAAGAAEAAASIAAVLPQAQPDLWAMEDDILLADLVADEIDVALSHPDSRAQLEGLRALSAFTDVVPDDLGGEVASSFSELVDEAVKTGDGRALFTGSKGIRDHATRIAGEREKTEGPDAEAWRNRQDVRNESRGDKMAADAAAEAAARGTTPEENAARRPDLESQLNEARESGDDERIASAKQQLDWNKAGPVGGAATVNDIEPDVVGRAPREPEQPLQAGAGVGKAEPVARPPAPAQAGALVDPATGKDMFDLDPTTATLGMLWTQRDVLKQLTKVEQQERALRATDPELQTEEGRLLQGRKQELTTQNDKLEGALGEFEQDDPDGMGRVLDLFEQEVADARRHRERWRSREAARAAQHQQMLKDTKIEWADPASADPRDESLEDILNSAM